MTEAEDGVMHFEDGGRGYQPRNAGGLQKVEKSRKRILFYSLQKDYSSIEILVFAHYTHFGLLSSKLEGDELCCFKPLNLLH